MKIFTHNHEKPREILPEVVQMPNEISSPEQDIKFVKKLQEQEGIS